MYSWEEIRAARCRPSQFGDENGNIAGADTARAKQSIVAGTRRSSALRSGAQHASASPSRASDNAAMVRPHAGRVILDAVRAPVHRRT